MELTRNSSLPATVVAIPDEVASIPTRAWAVSDDGTNIGRYEASADLRSAAWVINYERTAAMNSALASFDWQMGAFIVRPAVLGSSLAFTPLLARAAAEGVGGGSLGSATYFGVSGGLGGTTNAGLGWLGDQATRRNWTWSQGAGDFLSGSIFSSALPGSSLGYKVLYGSLGSTSSNFVTQGINYLSTGHQFDWGELGLAAGFGALGGYLSHGVDAAIPGLSSGRNNYLSTFNGVQTRIYNGYASSYSALTGFKGAVGGYGNDIWSRLTQWSVETAGQAAH